MDYVREELEFSGRIFVQNPVWPVIGQTKIKFHLFILVVEHLLTVCRVGRQMQMQDCGG